MKQGGAREVPLDKVIIDDADNSRVRPAGIDRLMESIKENGLIHPFTVRPDGDNYRVVAGFNRAHAVKQLGWSSSTVMVNESTDAKQLLLLQISENLDREQFTTYEMARALQRLVDAGMTRAQIVERLGRSHAWVSNYLGLFDLPLEVQERIKSDSENYNVVHVRFLHVMKKTCARDVLDEMCKKIAGFSQAQVNAFREKLEKKDVPPPAEADDTVVETPKSKKAAKLPELPAGFTRIPVAEADDDEDVAAEVDDDEEQIQGPRIARSATEVRDVVAALAQMGEDLEDAALAKVQGAIEALQWALGDDSIPLFEDVTVRMINGEEDVA